MLTAINSSHTAAASRLSPIGSSSGFLSPTNTTGGCGLVVERLQALVMVAARVVAAMAVREGGDRVAHFHHGRQPADAVGRLFLVGVFRDVWWLVDRRDTKGQPRPSCLTCRWYPRSSPAPARCCCCSCCCSTAVIYYTPMSIDMTRSLRLDTQLNTQTAACNPTHLFPAQMVRQPPWETPPPPMVPAGS